MTADTTVTARRCCQRIGTQWISFLSFLLSLFSSLFSSCVFFIIISVCLILFKFLFIYFLHSFPLRLFFLSFFHFLFPLPLFSGRGWGIKHNSFPAQAKPNIVTAEGILGCGFLKTDCRITVTFVYQF